MESDKERIYERILSALTEATTDQLLMVARFAENIVR